jgi:hypothetical protein
MLEKLLSSYQDIMAKTPDQPVMVRMTEDQLHRLDEFRRQEPDLPSRPEALRRLFEIGLRHWVPKKPVAPSKKR